VTGFVSSDTEGQDRLTMTLTITFVLFFALLFSLLFAGKRIKARSRPAWRALAVATIAVGIFALVLSIIGMLQQ
jgi:uncharacterized membrane protein